MTLIKINKHAFYIALNLLICAGFSYIFVLTAVEKDPFYTFLGVSIISLSVVVGLLLRKKWVILPVIFLIFAITPIALILLGGSFVWPPLLGLFVVLAFFGIIVLEIATIIHAFGF
jgi:hypothetical protein